MGLQIKYHTSLFGESLIYKILIFEPTLRFMLKRNIKISKPRLQPEDLEFSSAQQHSKPLKSNEANESGLSKEIRYPLVDITNTSPKNISITIPKLKD